MDELRPEISLDNQKAALRHNAKDQNLVARSQNAALKGDSAFSRQLFRIAGKSIP